MARVIGALAISCDAMISIKKNRRCRQMLFDEKVDGKSSPSCLQGEEREEKYAARLNLRKRNRIDVFLFWHDESLEETNTNERTNDTKTRHV